MSTAAQMAANQANAQHSTGPQTSEGKSESSLNNLRHGLLGAFRVLAGEDQDEFDLLLLEFTEEHQPATITERLLVQRMAQHHWFVLRAMLLQNQTFADSPGNDPAKQAALYLRYQTAHERAYSRCLADLLKLRTEKRRAEIGFESQQHKRNDEARKQELHEARLRALDAKAQDQELKNEARHMMQAPFPGHMRVPLDTMKDLFSSAVREVNRQLVPGPAA